MKQSNSERTLQTSILSVPGLVLIYLVALGYDSLNTEGAGRAQADFEYMFSLVKFGAINVLFALVGLIAVYASGSPLGSPKALYLWAMGIAPFCLYAVFWSLW